MKKLSTVLFVLFMFVNSSSSLFAQSACCGLDYLAGVLLQSGVSFGYGAQQFSAAGLNDYIKVYNNKRPALTKKMDDFGFAHGWRAGVNLIQLQDDRMFYGLSVFYQQIKEKHEAAATLPNSILAKREYDLTLISYGIGVSFSYVINKSFDFKIADVRVNWNKANFINRYTEGTNPSTEQVLKDPEASIGGQISTGLVYFPLPPYISLEASVGYSYFSINEMQFESSGQFLAKNEDSNEKMENFIDGGGLFAFAQLNIAIPFF
ncbi:MAG: hypothetical protein IT276_08875 [Ignavibacteriaceae bacterium]|nr:hypothetical protein [Ignavibacterium sp.]MCC6255014.1 hypothetical protein [Ignavibacteriaceae bacterium]HRN25613.1 hypothetical protein [Ignavibacteriaceae bacterium]HRP92472.1 hypothetical protein [Ignavibacteriaceae bacterium]HRQ53232.1 hypothetical protein [Ignavibacteriaceae bacterium]